MNPKIDNLKIPTEGPSASLQDLPAEVHLRIFDILESDPVSSTCLGLTCKKLYPMHVALHGKASLAAPYHEKCYSIHLATLLKNWTGIPPNSVYDAFGTQKFISGAGVFRASEVTEVPANMICKVAAAHEYLKLRIHMDLVEKEREEVERRTNAVKEEMEALKQELEAAKQNHNAAVERDIDRKLRSLGWDLERLKTKDLFLQIKHMNLHVDKSGKEIRAISSAFGSRPGELGPPGLCTVM